MSDDTSTQTGEATTQQEQFDPSRLACRVLDVHAAIQHAFTTFVQSGETTLDALAGKIQDSLGEVPAFLLGDEQNR